MSKGYSGLFQGTLGEAIALGEEVFVRIMPNGERNVDFSHLPGRKGIEIPQRLTDAQMEFLTREYGVEFAQVYILGNGKNGRGGKYYIYSGNDHMVRVPLHSKVILINHTHPRGSAYPSEPDTELMELLEQLGSPQRTSGIVPVGKKSIRFNKKGIKHYEY